jgi:hypothetical protein
MRLLAALALACSLVAAPVAAAADSGSTQISVTIGPNSGFRSVSASFRPTLSGDAALYTVAVDESISTGRDWVVTAALDGAPPVVVLEKGGDRPDLLYTQKNARTWSAALPGAGGVVVLTLRTRPSPP